ncbi:Lsr2 family protein [uncultured Kocuria sp.]|uniref:histone-like nucleoid-structuring protein Lsr2 n=1 Tax=uncultured Kocuria sp. TaxID=259305 RepID=UPI002625EA44|nr:Lsr2 family protein [uncultured Kocuria sp.]
MARTTQVVVTSDLSGEVLENPVGIDFSFAGADYHIDLSSDEATEFDNLLERYRNVATKVDNRRQTATRSSKSSTSDDRKEHIKKVREWAKSQNLEVSDRGRISAEIEAAYKSAHRNES